MGFFPTLRLFLNGDAMKALIEFIAKSLVEHPEQVEVREEQNGNRVRLELSVAKDDMGRVIGKNGRVANSIRTLLRVAAERDDKQATLDVMEP
jgi:predicted RNA-binding protein YlqC (UPF0109 family)